MFKLATRNPLRVMNMRPLIKASLPLLDSQRNIDHNPGVPFPKVDEEWVLKFNKKKPRWVHEPPDVLPPDPNVAYDPKDPRFLKGEHPYPDEKPYWDYTEEEIIELTKVEPSFKWIDLPQGTKVSRDQKPFNEVWQGDASDTFTDVKVITEPKVWAWVERYLPKPLPPSPYDKATDGPREELPSGWIPPPKTPPNLPYFVARTRNGLFPVYKETWPNDVIRERHRTLLRRIQGDIWEAEKDLREYIESKVNRKVLTAVEEHMDQIRIKGIYVHLVVDWLKEKGF